MFFDQFNLNNFYIVGFSTSIDFIYSSLSVWEKIYEVSLRSVTTRQTNTDNMLFDFKANIVFETPSPKCTEREGGTMIFILHKQPSPVAGIENMTRKP